MFDLFLNLSQRASPVQQPGQWNYIAQGLNRNVQKTRQYYQTHPGTARSNHFLIRLLESISTPQSIPLQRYYAHVDARALNLSMAMGMTSSISTGKVHRGIFYGGNTPEILLAVDDYFDVEWAYANWRNLQAVRPLLHAKSDVGLHLPNGVAYSNEMGIAVIEINVTMLAVQYLAWSQHGNRAPGMAQSINQFIAAYVWPNMLPSHLEIALLNRLYLHETQADTADQIPFRHHPFALPRFEYYLDEALNKSLDYAKKGNKEFVNILNTLPSTVYPSLYQALKMPDVAPTRQVDWVLCLARLKAYDLLFKIAGEDVLTRNQKHVNDVLRALARNNVMNLFFEELPPDALAEVSRYTSAILYGAERDFI